MTIYLYSIPAIVALIAKLVILYFSQRSGIQTKQVKLFRALVVLSILLNVAELSILQKPFEGSQWVGGVSYYAVSTLMIALMVHLAISISFDNWSTRAFLPVYLFTYGYAVGLVFIFVFFTPWLIAGLENLRGYSIISIPGPIRWVYELFVVICLLAALLLPMYGLRKSRSPNSRSSCKLWVAAATPLVLLVLVITALLHFKIHFFNATVTTPLLITILLIAIGYSVHNQRIIELDFYIPRSRTRQFKKGLYSRLASFGREIPRFDSIDALLDRLAETINCPVALVAQNTAFGTSEMSRTILDFPRAELRKINRILVANEIRTSKPHIHQLMEYHKIAAIVPFFPHSAFAARWLLLGETFSEKVYTPLDFKEVERLFSKMAGLFLDKTLEMETQLNAAQQKIGDLRRKQDELGAALAPSDNSVTPEANNFSLTKSLEQCVAEYEGRIIHEALARCNGNKAQAARMLGLRPNTLHYKLKRNQLSATVSRETK